MSAAPTLAFLKVDARRPLDDAAQSLDDASSKGFVKLDATLSPKFAASTTAYDVLIAPRATHVNVMATSFAPGCTIAIDGVIGNMATRPANATIEVTVTASGGEKTTYSLTTKATEAMSNDGEVVLKEKPKVDDEEEHTHGHSHDGVPCDGTHHSHGHGHSHAEGEKCEHDHGGEECHGHGHGEKKHDHGHSHADGEKCSDEKCEAHDHGHGHGEKKHDHGHGHGEKKDDHGHGHGEKKHDHGHGHGHGH